MQRIHRRPSRELIRQFSASETGTSAHITGVAVVSPHQLISRCYQWTNWLERRSKAFIVRMARRFHYRRDIYMNRLTSIVMTTFTAAQSTGLCICPNNNFQTKWRFIYVEIWHILSSSNSIVKLAAARGGKIHTEKNTSGCIGLHTLYKATQSSVG